MNPFAQGMILRTMFPQETDARLKQRFLNGDLSGYIPTEESEYRIAVITKANPTSKILSNS